SLPRTGSYRVRFTVCPSGDCTVQLGEGTRSFTIAAASSSEITIVAEDRLPIRPEVYPKLPDSVLANATERTVFDPAAVKCECAGGGGFFKPQWVTAGLFDTNAPYPKIEGEVFKS